MDYITFCRHYFEITQIPISLLNDSVPEYSALGEILNQKPQKMFNLYPPLQNPGFVQITPNLEYGRIKIEGTSYDIILGPVFNIPVTEEIVRQFMREQALPFQYKEQLTEFLFSMPIVNRLQLSRHLAFIYQCLHGKEAQINLQEYDGEVKQYRQHVQERMEALESGLIRNTYHFELGLYESIRNGNTSELKKYLSNTNISLTEGKKAVSPLRHTKNVFISLVEKAGLIGAIPGGLEIEKTYQLMDYYICECEKLQTIESVNMLQYTMLMDFCSRTGETRIPDGLSADVFCCMNYIRTHTNESITLDDVAAQINRSTSYLMKKFKQELGIHVGAYIMRCKLEEAKSLLIFSEKSLAEISSYLYFSSQSYFQNVFKKQYGITPLQYRTKHRKIL